MLQIHILCSTEKFRFQVDRSATDATFRDLANFFQVLSQSLKDEPSPGTVPYIETKDGIAQWCLAYTYSEDGNSHVEFGAAEGTTFRALQAAQDFATRLLLESDVDDPISFGIEYTMPIQVQKATSGS